MRQVFLIVLAILVLAGAVVAGQDAQRSLDVYVDVSGSVISPGFKRALNQLTEVLPDKTSVYGVHRITVTCFSDDLGMFAEPTRVFVLPPVDDDAILRRMRAEGMPPIGPEGRRLFKEARKRAAEARMDSIRAACAYINGITEKRAPCTDLCGLALRLSYRAPQDVSIVISDFRNTCGTCEGLAEVGGRTVRSDQPSVLAFWVPSDEDKAGDTTLVQAYLERRSWFEQLVPGSVVIPAYGIGGDWKSTPRQTGQPTLIIGVAR